MKLLKNENGNTTLFIIGLFGIFTLLFLVVLNFAQVLIDKERASNNAEQASIVATGIIVDSLEEAIYQYDATLTGTVEEILDKSLERRLNEAKAALRYDTSLTSSEVHHKAVNRVLREELASGNPVLYSIVRSQLNGAMYSLSSEVQSSIDKNDGELAETKIKVFNHNNRVEVETATRYEAHKFDEYFPESSRFVRQKAQGPTFEIAEVISWNWEY
ncbi:pilus assembly protein TadG-related protein [Fredinandcohnia humi]